MKNVIGSFNRSLFNMLKYFIISLFIIIVLLIAYLYTTRPDIEEEDHFLMKALYALRSLDSQKPKVIDVLVKNISPKKSWDKICYIHRYMNYDAFQKASGLDFTDHPRSKSWFNKEYDILLYILSEKVVNGQIVDHIGIGKGAHSTYVKDSIGINIGAFACFSNSSFFRIEQDSSIYIFEP